MRLIDADRLLKPSFTDMFDKPVKMDMFSRYAIESQPTVKAIPIEWFEWLLDTMGDGMYNLRAVIKDWERYKEDWGKENANIN